MTYTNRERECVCEGKRLTEKKKNKKKGENETTGEVGEGEILLSTFSLQRDKRLQHDGGRCQVMCDKSKLKMT